MQGADEPAGQPDETRTVNETGTDMRWVGGSDGEGSRVGHAFEQLRIPLRITPWWFSVKGQFRLWGWTGG